MSTQPEQDSTKPRTRRDANWITVPGLFSIPSSHQKTNPPASLYVIGLAEHPEYVKIGIAINIQFRIAELQTACPFKLLLLASKELPTKKQARGLKRAFHKLYAEQRVSGEWFRLADASALASLVLNMSAPEVP